MRPFLIIVLSLSMSVGCAAQSSNYGQDKGGDKGAEKAGSKTVNPGEAQAKSFTLPKADVVADVQPDGSVLITENMTYDFSGSFGGGYRDVPVPDCATACVSFEAPRRDINGPVGHFCAGRRLHLASR